MPNWLANKGAGPWGFEAQKDKLGYVNNPRWTGAPASLIEHDPCGYWLKGTSSSIPNPRGILYGTGGNEQTALGSSAEWVYWPNSGWRTLNKAQDWLYVGGGYGGSLAINSKGELWGVGNNTFGDLGAVGQLSNWAKLLSQTGWTQAVSGSFFSVVLAGDSSLWSSGLNSSGQLGLGDTTLRAVFTQITGATSWSKVACGYAHTLALSADGSLWGCGWNLHNQLYPLVGNPTTLGLLTSTVREMCGGYRFTQVIKLNGTLWGMGDNLYGGLGVGTANTANGLVQESRGFTDWVQISGGQYHSVGLRTNGTMWTSGLNDHGQLGVGDQTSRNIFTQVGTDTDWVEVRALAYHSLALKRDGTLWGWGDNLSNGLGFIPAADVLTPTQPAPGSTWFKLLDHGSFMDAVFPNNQTHSLALLLSPGSSLLGSPVPRPNPVWTMPS